MKLRNWGEDKTSFYLVLEYFSRGDLGNEIARHPKGMPMERVRQIGADLIKGIDTMHKQGVAHRDIKPHNILLGDNYEVKICDFSRAIKIEDIGSKGSRVGTKGYAAPEIRDLRKKYDQTIDIWSYGCTLYQMATGAMAFRGNNFPQEYAALDFSNLPLPLSNLLKKIWRVAP